MVPGKENSLFPSGPVIKCLMTQNKLIAYGREHHYRFAITICPLMINFAPILQSASLQNGSGEITCAQVLSLLSL